MAVSAQRSEARVKSKGSRPSQCEGRSLERSPGDRSQSRAKGEVQRINHRDNGLSLQGERASERASERERERERERESAELLDEGCSVD